MGTNFDSDVSEPGADVPLMATVQAQMQQITVGIPKSRLLDLPGGVYFSSSIQPMLT
jgi:hypothetical protein